MEEKLNIQPALTYLKGLRQELREHKTKQPRISWARQEVFGRIQAVNAALNDLDAGSLSYPATILGYSIEGDIKGVKDGENALSYARDGRRAINALAGLGNTDEASHFRRSLLSELRQINTLRRQNAA